MVQQLVRASIADSTSGNYRSGMNKVCEFRDWYWDEYGREARFREDCLLLLVAWCYQFHRMSEGTVKGYICAWRHEALAQNDAVSLAFMPRLAKAIKGYKRLVNLTSLQRLPISMSNGMMRQVLEYFTIHSAEIKERRQAQGHSVAHWSHSRRAFYVLFLFYHKLILRPEEAAVSRRSLEWRMPRWRDIRWYYRRDGCNDIVYTKVRSKNNQFGSEDQRIPCDCECPDICLPRALRRWRDYISKRMGSGQASDRSFIFRFSPSTIITQNQMYAEFNALKKFHHWSDRYQLYSIRIGRCQDLYVKGVSPEDIQQMGCWRSQSFMRYLKPTAENRLGMLKDKETERRKKQLRLYAITARDR